MADAGKPTTVIGADTQIKGEISFETTARVLGTIEGQISTKGELQIAEGATCKTTIEAGKVVVEGTVDGNVTARDRLELSPKAKMKGDLTAAKLVVAEGASLFGRVAIGPDALKGMPQTPGTPSLGRLGDALSGEPKPGGFVKPEGQR